MIIIESTHDRRIRLMLEAIDEARQTHLSRDRVWALLLIREHKAEHRLVWAAIAEKAAARRAMMMAEAAE